MKTKKIAAKRFKVTKTGKFLRRRQNARHLRAHKSKKQIRRFKKSTRVASAMERNLRVFIPYT